LGVDPTRVVYPVVALESSLFVPVSRDAAMHRWPAMEVLGAAAEAHLGFPLTEHRLRSRSTAASPPRSACSSARSGSRRRHPDDHRR
jgi:hypothetical protein